MKNYYQKLVTLLASRTTFVVIWLVALFQGAWVSISSRYPMAFDEAYHYNLIRMHAEQWNPLFLQQPGGLAPYGALVRDPSWLHHYVLSFPYRLFDALGANEFTKIVGLRLCNVAMFLLGLYLFRKLLLRTTASRAAIHASLLFFVLLPTVVLLGGQINYDNLQFPLLAAALLLTHRAAASLRAQKPDAMSLVGALAVSLLGSLNKFTFLPFLLAVVLYLSGVAYNSYGRRLRRLQREVQLSWKKAVGWPRYILQASVLVLIGLFVWFYGVNTVVYRNPVIQCHQVLQAERCEGFEPWLRNHNLAKELIKPSPNPVKFTVDWIGGMFYRTFFVINGASGPKRYSNYVPLGIAGMAVAILVVGVPLVGRYGRRVVRGDPMLQLALFATALYVVALWGRNYNDFLHLGQMVAINGRYFQPVLPVIILLFVASYQHAFRLMPGVKLIIFAVALLGFLSGGGITGFIHYSDANWYFEGKQWLISLNSLARKIVAPLFLWRH